MGTKQRIRFHVTKADVGVLLGELDEREASVLFARVFRQLRAVAVDPTDANGADLQIDVAHVDAFREWLDRTGLRHARNGDPMKARAFARHGRFDPIQERFSLGALEQRGVASPTARSPALSRILDAA